MLLRNAFRTTAIALALHFINFSTPLAFADVSIRDTSSFVTEATTIFNNIDSLLTTAQVDVPAKPSASDKSSAAKQKTEKRAKIILARRTINTYLQNLNSLVTTRPAGETGLPNLTSVNTTKLLGLYSKASLSTLVGTAAKTAWAKFKVQYAFVLAKN